VKNDPSDETLFMKVQQLSLDKFEFGQHIGQGCNAAVYEARLVEDEGNVTWLYGNWKQSSENCFLDLAKKLHKPRQHILNSLCLCTLS